MSEQVTSQTEEVIDELDYAITETAGEGGIVESLEAIAENLNSILSTGGSLDSAGFRMFNCAMDSNLRRIGLSHRETMPSLESFNDNMTRRGATKIAMEGVLDSISNALKKVWDWIAGLFRSIGEFIGIVDKKTEAVVADTKKTESKLDSVENGDSAPAAVVKLDDTLSSYDLSNLKSILPNLSGNLGMGATGSDDEDSDNDSSTIQVNIPGFKPDNVRDLHKYFHSPALKVKHKFDRSKKFKVKLVNDEAIMASYVESGKLKEVDYIKAMSKSVKGLGYLSGPLKLAHSNVIATIQDIIDGKDGKPVETTIKNIFDSIDSNAGIYGTQGLGGFNYTVNMGGNIPSLTSSFEHPTQKKDIEIVASFDDLVKLREDITKIGKAIDPISTEINTFNKAITDIRSKVETHFKDKQDERSQKELKIIRQCLVAAQQVTKFAAEYVKSTNYGVTIYKKIFTRVARSTTIESLAKNKMAA